MRLAQLVPEAENSPYETREDYRELITKALQELGVAPPKDFHQIWDEDDRDHNGAILQAIKIWKGATSSDENWGKANNAMWAAVNVRADAMEEAAQAFEDIIKHGVVLDSLKGLSTALKRVHEQYEMAKAEMKLVQQAYQILHFLNSRAITTVQSGEDAEDTRYKASIARATLKKMGLTPVDR